MQINCPPPRGDGWDMGGSGAILRERLWLSVYHDMRAKDGDPVQDLGDEHVAWLQKGSSGQVERGKGFSCLNQTPASLPQGRAFEYEICFSSFGDALVLFWVLVTLPS